MSKFNRDNFLKTITNNAGLEKELLTNSFSDYVFKYPCTYFIVKGHHLQRPDLISFDNFQRIDLWWFILKFNGIDDVWNELYVSQNLKIPDIRDINNYVNEYK
tara:strand:- start:6555 stop:6863 length:309 start_codon:yes stop_codon:yes gene_type:complete